MKYDSHSSAIASAIAFAAAVAVASAQPTTLEAQQVATGVVTTDVSGYRGNVTWLMLETNNGVVSGFEWSEQSDAACYLGLVYTDFLHGRNVVPGNVYNICADGRNWGVHDNQGSKREVKFGGSFNSNAVRGVQVCSTNANNHRLKGIRIFGARVVRTTNPTTLRNGERNLDPYTDTVERTSDQDGNTQSSCDSWRPAVYCPQADQVAHGVAVHRSEAGIIGLALRCRTMVLHPDR